MRHCVVGWVVPDISKDRLAFFCKDNAGAKYFEMLGAAHPVAEDWEFSNTAMQISDLVECGAPSW